MTQAQLVCVVARSTGESIRTIRHLGFTVQADGAGDPKPEDLRLVLDCPFCGAPVPYPGRSRDGSPALAECDRCEVAFDFDDAEVYAADRGAGVRVVEDGGVAA